MNPATRAYIRRATNLFLTDTCTLSARTGSINELGVPEETFTTVSTGVPCRVIMARGMMAISAEQVASRETLVDEYRIVLPAGTVIGNDYRVTVGTDVYDVIGVLDGRTDENDVQVRVVRVR